jgi:cell division transport system permease protein
MSLDFDVHRWWPAPLLPREDGRQTTLLFVIAVLSFLAGLSAIGGLAADRAANGWREELTGSATIIVRATGLETADAAAARAAETLAGVKGVTEARAIEKAKADALLEPWIGPEALPPDLPVPRLVAVELDRSAPATAADLKRAIKAAGLDATVDDHSLWAREIMRAGVLARVVAVVLFSLIVAAAGAAIAFATRQGLAARKDVVEILHLAGANDGFIAALFQARFARMSALAGIAGGAAATLAGAALRLFGQGQTLAAILPVRWTDLLAPLPTPFIAAAIAAATARFTAEAILRRSP